MMTNASKSAAAPLVLGIDTGGTYTDGVLLDYASRTVLATHKSLTTKRDLALGIEAVIDGIRIDDAAAVKMASISTTLATNAIAEGKGKRVGLILVGYDPDLIESFQMAGRFATPHYVYIDGGHDLYGREKTPLDLNALRSTVDQLKNQVDALAISSYFSPLNPEHELQAFAALKEVCDLPVVLGHQLSTKLGSVERATTAALNASLLAVLQEFVVAVRRALANRNIDPPLMVVRGDGTLMNDAFAAAAPVETIHSGPAASAMGGRFLADVEDALVVDVGGTTTDIAVVEGGQVAVSEEGATVGDYKTAVKAANLLSIALGGDSHITWGRDQRIVLGPERVVPLAHLAWDYPQILPRLKTLERRTWEVITPEWLDYWFLMREPQAERTLKSAPQRTLVAFLRDGPRPLPEILKHLDVLHPAQIDLGELFQREIIGRAGLTPTDLLHADGRFTPWSVQAAEQALRVFSRAQRRPPAEVAERVWARTSEIILRAIITFLSGKTFGPAQRGNGDIGHWFFDNSLSAAHPLLHTQFHLQLPIIGIGAPAAVFLQDVAAALHTDLILPEHFEVANAVGAVAGNVMVSEELLVYPQLSQEGLEVFGYYVQTNEGREVFEEMADALAHARTLGHDRMLVAAHQAGAENPEVVVEELSEGMDTVRVRVRAVGNPRLGG